MVCYHSTIVTLVPKNRISSQDRVYFQMGQLMAISVVSSGNGFNLMSIPVYKYICGSELSTIVFQIEDLPSDVKTMCSEVCNFGVVLIRGRRRIYNAF